MASNYQEWYFQLVNRRTGRPVDDDTGLFIILTASDPTRLTAYSDGNGTSLTQPATMTNGVCRFWLDSSTTSADVSILTAAGRAYFLEGVTPSQHRVDVDPERTDYQFIVNWHANTASNAVADTGFDLIAGMRIKDVFVHVTTAIATGCTMDIGRSGDTDGFLDGINAGSSTGWRTGNVVAISGDTSLAHANYIQVTQFRGADLIDYGAGIATATTGGEKGFWAPKPYLVTAATSLVWVLTLSNTAGTGEGYIYLEYDLLPTMGN